ncbi:MAG: dihydrodipicolinate synthase family protein [Acidobacteriota bacterium]|nr:dihydrodipicolinate synthase family protein [Acidobacteriota bacterium]
MPQTKTPVPASGVYAALATPRRPNSIEADTAVFLEYLDKVSSGGVDGFVLFGSTGEFVHFEVEERMRVVGLAVKRSRVPALVNVSHSTLAGAIELMHHAMDSGASGVLVMPPYFFRYADAEIACFYDAFIKAAEGQVPIYLYNLPQFTDSISLELAERLLASGAFAGIKDSGGDWDNFEHLRNIRDRHAFQLLIGNESIYLRGLKAGADGVVSGVAAALPELPVAIQRAVRTSDLETAQALGTRLNELMTWIARFPATVAIKQIAETRGWMRADVANPLGSEAVEDLRRMREWITAWLPATLSQCAAATGVRT